MTVRHFCDFCDDTITPIETSQFRVTLYKLGPHHHDWRVCESCQSDVALAIHNIHESKRKVNE